MKFTFLFANTGKEREETLEFVHQCDRYFRLNLIWLEARVHPAFGEGTTYTQVNFHSASRKGEPFEAMIQKYGIPNEAYPHCTRELKLRPMYGFLKNTGQSYTHALGIRRDEMRRPIVYDSTKLFPLIQHSITQAHVRQFWDQMPFDLALKDHEGNCDLCWKKSVRKKKTLILEKESIADWWLEMEARYSRRNYFFHRNNEPTSSLVAKASKGDFEPYTDAHKRKGPLYDALLDQESDCHCALEYL